MIVHNFNLVILLIFINLKIVKKLYYKLMSKLNLSLYILNILQIIVNFASIKFIKFTYEINYNLYYNSKFKRKDHTPLKTSYNKS